MKIILEQDKCIGCGSCEAICPKHFKLKNHKSTLIKGKKKGNNFEKEIDEKDLNDVQDAADSCPAMCIHIKK